VTWGMTGTAPMPHVILFSIFLVLGLLATCVFM